VQSSTPIRKLEDLASKKIAYSRPGSSTHMAALAIADQIKAKGLKPAEVVSLGGIPEVYTAVRTGQTDAGWSVAPFQLDLVEKGALRVLVKGDEITDTAKIWIRRAEMKYPEPAVLKTWDFYNRAAMTLKPIRGLQATIEDGIRNKFLTQPLSEAEIKSLIDLSFLP
jgi:ABC-type nitrate/sulfonate/bicarbonate transport system substrate-binding protein